MDAPSIHRPRLLTFLGLSHQPPPGSDVSDGPPNYAAMHAASLKSYSAKPMHNHTRQALDAFFAPHNRKLADLLGWEGARDLWRVSRPLPPGPGHWLPACRTGGTARIFLTRRGLDIMTLAVAVAVAVAR